MCACVCRVRAGLLCVVCVWWKRLSHKFPFCFLTFCTQTGTDFTCGGVGGAACATSARSATNVIPMPAAYVDMADSNADGIPDALIALAASANDQIGKSDYRMNADGSPVERDIPNPMPYCRYCNRPGVKCSDKTKDGEVALTAGDPCNTITVSGGDQQPGTLKEEADGSHLFTTIAADAGNRLRASSPTATWRGDVSSAAQLVFDSRNWNVPQTVSVTAFQDTVYEPAVNGRGQDAYVHHFVVAQDENLQHTYYDDIDVNDLVVSITDDDHAVVVQALNSNGVLTPEEGYDYHSPQSTGCSAAGPTEYNDCVDGGTWTTRGNDELVLKLSSEPMYDVAVYVQSGPFFDGTPSAATILPDDEQVIFQDTAMYETCFTVSDTIYAPTCLTDYTTAPGCDPHGDFIAGESYTDQTANTPHQLPFLNFGAGYTGSSYPNGLDVGVGCGDLATEAECRAYQSAGCKWDTTCQEDTDYSAVSHRKLMDFVCATVADGDCPNTPGCYLQAAGSCKGDRLGYDCNSYVVFTSTNWAVAQTLKVIALDDDDDEVTTLGGSLHTAATGRSAPAAGTIAGSDWTSPMGAKGPFGDDPSVVGYLIASQDWYYNSLGAEFMASTRTGYQPTNNGPSGFSSDSLLDPGSVTTADCVADAEASASLVTPFDGVSAVGTVTLSMFDTRFGHHINRYPYTTGDADVPSQARSAGTCARTSSPYFDCLLDVDFAEDAANEVCLVGAGSVWAAQVDTFDPSRYVADGATCGATVNVQDNDDKGVLVSRSSCEATEGRRTYYQLDWDDTADNAAGFKKDPTTTNTRFGLFYAAADWPGVSTPVYGATDPSGNADVLCAPTPTTLDNDCNGNPWTGPIDYWTASNVKQEERDGVMQTNHANALYMTMPTCPLTVQLSSAPAEGKTVVVTIEEDANLAALRDNELYFYEEPTFRYLTTDDGTLSAACGASAADAACLIDCDRTYPGSSWLENHDSGSCFINNVPWSGTAFTPKGGTSLDITFTANDWSLGRRVTIIALNDDVDEPPETRVASFSVNTGTSTSAGTTDPFYLDATIQNADVTVQVFDDDIADLVLLCGDGLGSTIGRHATDAYAEDSSDALNFLGSYDDALVPDAGMVEAGSITGLTDYRTTYGQDLNADTNIDTTAVAGVVDGVGRIGYSAEDGLAHGYEHSFGGGGRPGQTMGASVGVAAVTGDDGAPLTPALRGYKSATEAQADGTDDDIAAGCVAGNDYIAASVPGTVPLERCYPDTWVDWDEYDAYHDTYKASGVGFGIHDGATSTDSWNHVRGFKGVGPAASEADDNYACTIHTRECLYSAVGSCYLLSDNSAVAETDYTTCISNALNGWTYYLDNNGDACEGTNVGSFKVRLNSSPGTKTVRRQYVGETTTVDEGELVYVVITPDVTPQTMFEPASLTFTETGGYVNGAATERWDKPAEFKVRPVDDNVDERRGFVVDFTAFTITQSHFGDNYWTYTTPYQVSADVGDMHVYADGGTGRVETHTPYRHTIRTVHTLDNDLSGVTVDSGISSAGGTAAASNADPGTWGTLTATEGGTFTYYTLTLDTQPAKIQRQAGTGPNADYQAASSNGCGDGTDHVDGVGVDAFSSHGYHADNTYISRVEATCGSVEPPASYWVDVTVTQSIHVDLAVPPSCPTTAPWGGGSTPPTARHPRFPFNAYDYDSDGDGEPYDEVNFRYEALDKYLTTCGTWQRDATYRFDSTNWDVPQYVYVYAHNDKDGGAGQGGSEEGSATTIRLKHYVETEDATHNCVAAQGCALTKFIQRNKHGGIYTWGNLERYPFGASATSDAGTAAISTLHDTGFTTYGYSSYETLYGYVQMDAASGYPTVSEPCCSPHMPDVSLQTGLVAATWANPIVGAGAHGAYGSCAFSDAYSAGNACIETVTADAGQARPYTAAGMPCLPKALLDGTAESDCVSPYAKVGQVTGTSRGESGYGTALEKPPMDVLVEITDNDAQTAQSALTGACRQTRLFQFADAGGDVDDGVDGTRDAVLGTGVLRTKWLTDYNCDNGDAGGLPGYPSIAYPVLASSDYGAAGTGYCTDKSSTTSAACTGGFCSVQGTCASGGHIYAAEATVSTECGTCDQADRYTQAECEKNLGGNTGTWTPGGGWDASSHDSQSECEGLGLTWTDYRWIVHPLGSGLIAQGTLQNLQCCSCLPAFKSGVLASTLLSYTDEVACNAAAGGTWTCSGVGPHCET
eukprot:SAG11_NODE_14_length_26344_cov_14.209411_10_plen_2210_part_00